MPRQHNTNNKFLVCGYTKRLNTTTDPYSTDRSYCVITDAHVTRQCPGVSVDIPTSQTASRSVLSDSSLSLDEFAPFYCLALFMLAPARHPNVIDRTHQRNTQAYIIHLHNCLFIEQYTCTFTHFGANIYVKHILLPHYKEQSIQ